MIEVFDRRESRGRQQGRVRSSVLFAEAAAVDEAYEQDEYHQCEGKIDAKDDVDKVENASREGAQPVERHTLVGRLAQIAAVLLASYRLVEQEDGNEHVGGYEPYADDYTDAGAEFAHAGPTGRRAHRTVQTQKHDRVREHVLEQTQQVHFGLAPVRDVYKPGRAQVAVRDGAHYREYDHVESVREQKRTHQKMNRLVTESIGAYYLQHD